MTESLFPTLRENKIDCFNCGYPHTIAEPLTPSGYRDGKYRTPHCPKCGLVTFYDAKAQGREQR